MQLAVPILGAHLHKVQVGTPRKSEATRVDAVNSHGRSLVGVGASAGPLASDVIGSSLEPSSLQQKLSLLVSGAQRKFIPDHQK